MRSLVVVTIAIFGLVTGLLLWSPGHLVMGGEAGQDLALIIISDFSGGSKNEMEKGIDFYDHLTSEGYEHDDIIFLAPWGVDNRDGSPTTCKIDDAFQYLIDDTSVDKDIVIWISDHSGADTNGTYFQFTDGSITADEVDDWMNDIDCDEMTVIIGGTCSGLAGPELAKSGRTIISSMGHDQFCSPDLFDIARGLTTATADTNGDGIISYREAYVSEVSLINWSGQKPGIWED